MSKLELLFSVSIADMEVQTFRCPGKGGQKVNKTSSGVRLIHHPSGARGESVTSRSQGENKRLAFIRLAESKEFQAWHKMEVARRLGKLKSAAEAVEKAMEPENLKVEVKDEAGRWVEAIEAHEEEVRRGR